MARRADEMNRRLKEQGLKLAGNYSDCTHICRWDWTEWNVYRWFECTVGDWNLSGHYVRCHDGDTGFRENVRPKDTDSCRVGSEVIAYYGNQK